MKKVSFLILTIMLLFSLYSCSHATATNSIANATTDTSAITDTAADTSAVTDATTDVSAVMDAIAGSTAGPVKDGSPLCRDDFNFYDDKGVLADPDTDDDGCILLGSYAIESDRAMTARSISIDDPIDKVIAAYKDVPADVIYIREDHIRQAHNKALNNFIESQDENKEITASYILDGYQLYVRFSNGVVDSISASTPESVAESEQDMDEFAQDTLTEEQYEKQQQYNSVLDSFTDEEQDMFDEMLTHDDDLDEWLSTLSDHDMSILNSVLEKLNS